MNVQHGTGEIPTRMFCVDVCLEPQAKGRHPRRTRTRCGFIVDLFAGFEVVWGGKRWLNSRGRFWLNSRGRSHAVFRVIRKTFLLRLKFEIRDNNFRVAQRKNSSNAQNSFDCYLFATYFRYGFF